MVARDFGLVNWQPCGYVKKVRRWAIAHPEGRV
jgi:hypothetical protein